MKSWKPPTAEMIDRVLSSVKKETDRQYFFSRLNNPLWVMPLSERGYFKNPPGVKQLPDGYVQYPYWPELAYLVNISNEAADQVIDTVLGLPSSDNPRIYESILEIAIKVDHRDSAKLLPKLIEYVELDNQFLAHRYPELLQHWASLGLTCEALALVKRLVPFQKDPNAYAKQKHRKAHSESTEALLEPMPRFQQWDYQKILEDGVGPLAELVPFQIGQILIDAVADMIRFGKHSDKLQSRRDEDYSEIWCRRLDKPGRNYQSAKESLVFALTHACEQVFQNAPESVVALDQNLRKQRWKVFRRLRQFLFSQYPSDQTLPWTRELIFDHKDYPRWEYHYEFQLMINKACEHFGRRLLNESESKVIFDAILSGPDKDSFREWMGAGFSEDIFEKRQRRFHRLQLHPFSSLLTGEYRRYFDELNCEAQSESVSDDSYPPYGVTSGWVSHQSPKSLEDLQKLSDVQLLAYLNDWNDEHHEPSNWLVEINISALADEFQKLFKARIAPKGSRLSFWIEHRDRVLRPIYVAAMANAMREMVNDKNFENLDKWIEFCAWILSRPASMQDENQPEHRDDSSENPDWDSSRRSVVDFIDACLKKDTEVPLAHRDGLSNLLRAVCNQPDWRLDSDQPVLLNRDDAVTEAINNTRGRALESLINLGFWIRRSIPDDPVTEVTDTLSLRLAGNAEFPLTGPEFALLGLNFGKLCALNLHWANENRKILFPQSSLTNWLDAFSGYMRFNRPVKTVFEVLREEFEFALEKLTVLSAANHDRQELVDKLGQHVFTYYLWRVYSLKGEDSLLARFYAGTNEDRRHWARLFDHVGHSLSNSGKQLEDWLIERVIAYFDWRFGAAEPVELQEFTFWLSAECLDPEWRLRSYSKILDLADLKDAGLTMEIKALGGLLQDFQPLVVECFAKFTDALSNGANFYVSTDEAKPILVAGLNSPDLQVRENAERARENLLRHGRFDFLDLE